MYMLKDLIEPFPTCVTILLVELRGSLRFCPPVIVVINDDLPNMVLGVFTPKHKLSMTV
jgi:hypothetical protein